MSLAKSIAEWRPRTPFYYGWLMLGVGSMATFASTGLTQIVLGGIQTIISEDTGWSGKQIAFAATIGSWSAGLLTPLVGKLADRYGPRGIMPIAALISGGSCVIIGGSNSIWQFYLAVIIGRSIIDSALMGVVPLTAAVNFFQRRRNLAISLMSMAFPVGSAINIQIISILSGSISWRFAYRYYLGIFGLAMAVPLVLVMRRRPEDIGLRPDGDPPHPSGRQEPLGPTRSSGRTAAPTEEFDWRAGEALRTPAFWMMGALSGLGAMTFGVVLFQIVPYLEDSGLSRVAAFAALSLTTLVAALLSPGWGYLADRFHPRNMALVTVPISAAVMSLVLFSGGGGLGFGLLILWAAFHGGALFVLNSAIVARYFGRASFGSITGMITLITMLSLGFGPLLSALLVDATEGFSALFVFVMAAHFLAFLLYYNARTPRLPSRVMAGG